MIIHNSIRTLSSGYLSLGIYCLVATVASTYFALPGLGNWAFVISGVGFPLAGGLLLKALETSTAYKPALEPPSLPLPYTSINDRDRLPAWQDKRQDKKSFVRVVPPALQEYAENQCTIYQIDETPRSVDYLIESAENVDPLLAMETFLEQPLLVKLEKVPGALRKERELHQLLYNHTKYFLERHRQSPLTYLYPSKTCPLSAECIPHFFKLMQILSEKGIVPCDLTKGVIVADVAREFRLKITDLNILKTAESDLDWMEGASQIRSFLLRFPPPHVEELLTIWSITPPSCKEKYQTALVQTAALLKLAAPSPISR